MDTVLYDGFVVLTPWKLVGYFGVACFALRWVFQMIASHRAQKVTVPVVFWAITVVGAYFQLVYWIFGPKNDSVGVLQSLAPFVIALYNLVIEMRKRRADAAVPAAQAQDP